MWKAKALKVTLLRRSRKQRERWRNSPEGIPELKKDVRYPERKNTDRAKQEIGSISWLTERDPVGARKLVRNIGKKWRQMGPG